MFNLAIECSGIAGSIALFRSDEMLSTKALDTKASSVQTLAPAIKALLSQVEIERVDLISVTSGPGSFTGLRVGLATAKMLSFAWECPIAAVDTLEAIALRTSKSLDQPTYVLPSINAFRNQLFVGCWLAASGQLTRCTASHLADAAEWKANPAATFEKAWINANLGLPDLVTAVSASPCQLTGPGLEKYQPAASLPQADSALWNPAACEVGELGLRLHAQYKLQSATTLRANYVRSSAAEENAKRK